LNLFAEIDKIDHCGRGAQWSILSILANKFKKYFSSKLLAFKTAYKINLLKIIFRFLEWFESDYRQNLQFRQGKKSKNVNVVRFY
jgi:hypothetical protein